VVNDVDSAPALLLLTQQSRLFQDAQVPRRGWPFVCEAPSDLAGGRLPTKVNREQNLPACRMRERRHDGVERRELSLRV